MTTRQHDWSAPSCADGKCGATGPEALRDAGMQAAENAADPRLRLMVDALIEDAIDSGEWFSANDIRDRMPVVGNGLVGARVRAFSMRRPQVMWPVGRVPSNLNSTHGKEIIVWQGPSGSTSARRGFQQWRGVA